MARGRLLATGALLTLLLGTVIVPALLSLTVGIIALALWREAFDIVFGVLVLCFAAMSVVGGVVAIAFLRRSARLAEMQSDFVANVSHDLRTPLAGIRLMAETLALGRAEEPGKRAEVLELLAAEVERLEELVGRILRWRRMEAGRAAYELAPQAVAGLLEEATAGFGPGPNGDGPDVQVRVDEDVPEVRADREALVDALRNLVHNAVKFGADRGPVEVLARRDGPDVVVEVRDQGPGIPRKDHKHVFERFYRVPVHPRARQGTGLGLAIVRSVVDSHKGRVWVESEPGIGTAFLVRLPAVPEAAPGEGGEDPLRGG